MVRQIQRGRKLLSDFGLTLGVLPMNLGEALSLSLLLLLPSCAPRAAAPPTKSAAGTYHVVRPGENLYRIGKAYDLSHEQLARINKLRDPDQIRPGQKIFVPGAVRPLPVEIITPGSGLELPARWETQGAVDPMFIWPISGAINSRFGPRDASFHDGIDIAAPAGTPIRAIDGGEVIYSDHLRGYGNMVIIRHTDGFVSVYAHNEKNLVAEGQQVSRGETIARVGSTGRVTGPHLHFEIRRNNKAEDPLSYMPRPCCAERSDDLVPTERRIP
jgi:murein DD-endopeptidase MepM/ murein hydrolase activator NlpD